MTVITLFSAIAVASVNVRPAVNAIRAPAARPTLLVVGGGAAGFFGAITAASSASSPRRCACYCSRRPAMCSARCVFLAAAAAMSATTIERRLQRLRPATRVASVHCLALFLALVLWMRRAGSAAAASN